MGLVVVSEAEGNKTLLVHKISDKDIYHRSGGGQGEGLRGGPRRPAASARRCLDRRDGPNPALWECGLTLGAGETAGHQTTTGVMLLLLPQARSRTPRS